MTDFYFKRIRKKYITWKNMVMLAFFSRVDVASAAATSATGTALATVAGYDPWTWVVGGLGAAIVYIKKEVASRLDAITNSVVSVMLAGLVSPALTDYASHKLSLSLTSPYPVAFILSASWPWIVPILMSVFKVGK
jgi:uncharacterized membrane protein YdcZ (DUF606 family)